jgi:hypothetical protein
MSYLKSGLASISYWPPMLCPFPSSGLALFLTHSPRQNFYPRCLLKRKGYIHILLS